MLSVFNGKKTELYTKSSTPKFYASLGHIPPSPSLASITETASATMPIKIETESSAAGTAIGSSNELIHQPYSNHSKAAPTYVRSRPSSLVAAGVGVSQLVDLSEESSDMLAPVEAPFHYKDLQEIAKRAVLLEDLDTLEILFNKGVFSEKLALYKETQLKDLNYSDVEIKRSLHSSAQGQELAYLQYLFIKSGYFHAFKQERYADLRYQITLEVLKELGKHPATNSKLINIYDQVINNDFKSNLKNMFAEQAQAKPYAFCNNLYELENELKKAYVDYENELDKACEEYRRMLEALQLEGADVRRAKAEFKTENVRAKHESDALLEKAGQLVSCMDEIVAKIKHKYEKVFSTVHPNGTAFAKFKQDKTELNDTDILTLFFSNLDINFKGTAGNTLSHFAVIKNKQFAFKKLIELGADFNQLNDDSASAAALIYLFDRRHFTTHVRGVSTVFGLADSLTKAKEFIRSFYDRIYPQIGHALGAYEPIIRQKQLSGCPFYPHRSTAYDEIYEAFNAVGSAILVGEAFEKIDNIHNLLSNIDWLGTVISTFYATKNVPTSWYHSGGSRLLDPLHKVFSVHDRNSASQLVLDIAMLENFSLAKPDRLLTGEERRRRKVLLEMGASNKVSRPQSLQRLAEKLCEKEDSAGVATLPSLGSPVLAYECKASAKADKSAYDYDSTELKHELLVKTDLIKNLEAENKRLKSETGIKDSTIANLEARLMLANVDGFEAKLDEQRKMIISLNRALKEREEELNRLRSSASSNIAAFFAPRTSKEESGLGIEKAP